MEIKGNSEPGDIVLTGRIGVGKTTVLEKAVRILEKKGKRVAGIMKPAIMEGGRRAGFIVVDVETGKSKVLARKAPAGGGDTLSYPSGKDGRTKSLSSHYAFEQEGFDFADVVFKRLLSNVPQDLIVVDELGLFEARGEGFSSAVKLLKRKQRSPMLVIVREDVLERILPLFPCKPEVIKVDENNRETLPDAVAKRFLNGSI